MKVVSKFQKSNFLIILITLTSVFFLVLIWYIVYYQSDNKVLVPSPLQVLSDFGLLIMSKKLWLSILYSLCRVLIGFVISAFFGLLVGIIAGQNKYVYAFFLPYLIIMRSTPVISFILLVLIWFSSGNVAVFIAFLIMFPLLCTTIIKGVQSIDKELIEMSQVYAFSLKKKIIHIYIPGITPFLLTGASNALGMGWRAVIIGEVISQPLRGIGTNMHEAHSYLRVSELIAWTLAAIIIGYLFEYALQQIEKQLSPWKTQCDD